MVICLEQGADLHMAQLMSLPLTVSCFSKIQIHPGSPGKRPLNGCVSVCVCVCARARARYMLSCMTCTGGVDKLT